jgi:glycosyltransferase involved in cell wall biosynthesis
MTTVSALVVVHNEEDILAACLEKLSFADELVVVLDKCTDASRDIALSFTDAAHLVEGSWELEGPRRNAGLAACAGDWVVEIDADEHVPPELAREIRAVIATSAADYHDLPVDNYIGTHRVRYGWGASFGTSAVPRLSRKGAKVWGEQRVHPALSWHGRNGNPAVKGPILANRIDHYVDAGISDMLHRLDRYSTARARDLRESGNPGSLANNVRRFFSRFYKCYVGRKGYREGGWGFLIAVCAGLYPLLSYLKATLEKE